MCSSAVDRQGYLLKRGEINKSFQKRYFVLKGNLLFYFEQQDDAEPAGVIILEGCTVELAEDEREPYSFKVIFHGAGARTYILSAENHENMEAWMKSIACAGYDYVKTIVTELQRQLEELEEAERKQSMSLQDSSSSLDVASHSSNASTSRSGAKPRFNPFNKIPVVAETDIFCMKSTLAQGRRSPSADSKKSYSSGCSSKESFLDLHEQFGNKIRKQMEERKKAETEAPLVTYLSSV